MNDIEFRDCVGTKMLVRHYMDDIADVKECVIIDVWDSEVDGDYALLLMLDDNRTHSYGTYDWEIVKVLDKEVESIGHLICTYGEIKKKVDSYNNVLYNMLTEIEKMNEKGLI